MHVSVVTIVALLAAGVAPVSASASASSRRKFRHHKGPRFHRIFRRISATTLLSAPRDQVLKSMVKIRQVAEKKGPPQFPKAELLARNGLTLVGRLCGSEAIARLRIRSLKG
jgi:hypothetical protein